MKLVVKVAAFAALMLVGCSPEPRTPGEATPTEPAELEEVIRTESVSPYPEATQVSLVILAHDAPPIPDTRGRVLTSAERARFEATLRHTTRRLPPDAAPSTTGPACFIPHHFFRYLDAAGKEVGRISVCFCCGGVAAGPLLPFQSGWAPDKLETHVLEIDQKAAESFVASLGLPTDVGCQPVTPPSASPA